MVATSVGITAQVLASKGVIDHIASRIILAAAVIDDVLGLIVLALVGSMAEGRINWLELGLTAVGATAFTLIVARWGASAMETFLPRVERRLRAREAQFADDEGADHRLLRTIRSMCFSRAHSRMLPATSPSVISRS